MAGHFALANNSRADIGKLVRYLAVIDGSPHRNLQTLARLQALRGLRAGAEAVETVAFLHHYSGHDHAVGVVDGEKTERGRGANPAHVRGG
ncbi:MAG: hypothetical protein EXQ87_04875 [Alphaproteobacteria bacterium]|nr:hypothetical protein [Alphaproteobacteria bacterium]